MYRTDGVTYNCSIIVNYVSSGQKLIFLSLLMQYLKKCKMHYFADILLIPRGGVYHPTPVTISSYPPPSQILLLILSDISKTQENEISCIRFELVNCIYPCEECVIQALTELNEVIIYLAIQYSCTGLKKRIMIIKLLKNFFAVINRTLLTESIILSK